MCGIAGFNFSDKNLIVKLTDLIKHRGPDSHSFFIDDNLSLGHTRLRVLDLSDKGIQPMTDNSGNYVIVYNGEIFNFQKIKSDLISKGYIFKSNTDTEVLLYGYIEYGKKILNILNGQFAFCIYDKERKELFLSRDRFGINPLYYYFDGEKFIFGSELKIILKSGVRKKINEFALNYYFLYGYTPSGESIIKNSRKLKPGNFITFNLEKKILSKEEEYWSLKNKKIIKNEIEAKEKVLTELDRAVKERMVADVPVGAFLSGGVDSSAIVAIMSKYTNNLNTFSVKFDKEGYDESYFAEIISKKFNTNHHVVEFGSKDVRNLLPKLIYHYDEPFGDSSMIPTYLVSKVASKYVTVSLSGDGGDELFSGYNSYKKYKLLSIQKFYPKFVNLLLLKLIYIFNIKNDKLKKFLEIGLLDRKLKFAKLSSYLYTDEFKKISGDNPEKYYEKFSASFRRGNYVNEATVVDVNNYLTEDILCKVDRSSMANSLESRPPILDHKLVELAFSIDPKLKIKNKEGKYIFKKSLEDILPKEILYREKKGFSVPLEDYLKGDLRDLVDKYILDYSKHEYISLEMKDYIKEKLSQKKWDKDYSRIIWTILIFNMWHEKWMI